MQRVEQQVQPVLIIYPSQNCKRGFDNLHQECEMYRPINGLQFTAIALFVLQPKSALSCINELNCTVSL